MCVVRVYVNFFSYPQRVFATLLRGAAARRCEKFNKILSANDGDANDDDAREFRAVCCRAREEEHHPGTPRAQINSKSFRECTSSSLLLLHSKGKRAGGKRRGANTRAGARERKDVVGWARSYARSIYTYVYCIMRTPAGMHVHFSH